MRTTRWLALLGVVGTLALPAKAQPDEIRERAEPDIDFLRKAGVPTDGAGLLVYLRRRADKDADVRDLAQLIRQLGSSRFREREQAARKLIDLGPAALPGLRRALQGKDADTARRAQDCIEAIARDCDPALVAATVRVLARLQPEGTAEALLRYLPYAPDEDVSEEIWFALDALAAHWRQAPPVVAKALGEALPARRAAAAYLLGRWGERRQRTAVRPLLTDAQGEVRLRAAQGLLGAKDKEAVPALVALLGDPSVEVAWQAEEMLRWVAGEDAPQATLGAASPQVRRQCTRAWEAWWRKCGGTLDLDAPEQDYRRPGLFLVCEEEISLKKGRVWLCGCDGRPRWQLDNLRGPSDVRWLGGDRVLVAEGRAPRVAEYDLGGKLHWQHSAPVHTCRRLPGGNTLVIHRERTLQVTPDGRVAARQPGQLPEADAVVKAAWPHDLPRPVAYPVPLRGGNTLGACGTPGYCRLLEVNGNGKVVWEAFTPLPTWAGCGSAWAWCAWAGLPAPPAWTWGHRPSASTWRCRSPTAGEAWRARTSTSAAGQSTCCRRWDRRRSPWPGTLLQSWPTLTRSCGMTLARPCSGSAAPHCRTCSRP
jgi:HEAT repeat protein